MVQRKSAGNTPLTESQARAIASWWSVRYLRLQPQQEGGEPLHGVKLPRGLKSEAAVIYFWEEVKCLEHQRSSVNPKAPDWVG